LQGLFTAHVTGNFVTIGAALVFGTSGVVAKLLALPVFCIVIRGQSIFDAERNAATFGDSIGLASLPQLLRMKLMISAAS
jgi:uncharacterized membrane protein YoaK (UPF0700 family)